MNKKNISLNAGNLFTTKAGTIVIPRSTTGTVSDKIRRDALAYISWDIPTEPLYKNLGEIDFISHTFLNSRGVERTVLLILVVSVDNDFSSYEVIEIIANSIAEKTSEISSKGDIAIPLIGAGAGRLDHLRVYEILVKAFFLHGNDDWNLIVYTNNKQLSNVLKESEDRIFAELLPMTVDPDSDIFKAAYLNYIQSTDFYFVDAYWADDQTKRFIENGIWENGFEERYYDIINSVKAGSNLFLKKHKPNVSETKFVEIYAWGIVTSNVGNGRQLKVNWMFIYNSGRRAEYYGDTSSTVIKIQQNYVNYFIEKFPNWQEKLNGIFAYLIEQRNQSSQANSSLIRLNNDSERGEDLLNIQADVHAFARLIAYKNFRPPLAIALFGKWGSGKSFFMHKLMEKVSFFAEQQNPEFYCEGVAQIHFNAWSYLDANLWASLISRIFESLNRYISKDELAKDQRDLIEKSLGEKLSLSYEEITVYTIKKENFEASITKLEADKAGIDAKLEKKIEDIRKKSITEVIKKVDEEFKAKERIQKALRDNKSLVASEDQLTKLLPEKYWEDPGLAYKKAASVSTFLKAFLKKEKLWFNILSLIIIAAIILFTPKILEYLKTQIIDFDFSIAPITKIVRSLAIFYPIISRLISVSKKYSPFVKSLWKIKEAYEKEISEAKNASIQEEKAIKFDIEKNNAEIAAINQQITETNEKLALLEFKKNKALATEALYHFIENRYSSDEYQKHLGIVSIIRKDLEILSSLFDSHNEENISAEFKKLFDRPLERIILYIDDLDRCPAERVVQVLEAVNLLMAFPLFIVVVGVDQNWVKNALENTYNVQQLSAADYLEKIFQVPFHLKPVEDREIKNMIKKLSEASAKPIDSSASLLPDEGSAPSLTETTDAEIENEQKENSDELEIGILNEDNFLTLSQIEIQNLEAMSLVIGNNPRSVKRFINVYQIMRAHEGLAYHTIGKENEFLNIMFLLAMFFGKYKSLCIDFLKFMHAYGYEDRRLSEFLHDDQKETKSTREAKHRLNVALTNHPAYTHLQNQEMNAFLQHIDFVNRFTFAEVEVE